MKIEIYLRNSSAVIIADVEDMEKKPSILNQTINFTWTNVHDAANRQLFFLRVDDVAAIVAVHDDIPEG